MKGKTTSIELLDCGVREVGRGLLTSLNTNMKQSVPVLLFKASFHVCVCMCVCVWFEMKALTEVCELGPPPPAVPYTAQASGVIRLG